MQTHAHIHTHAHTHTPAQTHVHIRIYTHSARVDDFNVVVDDALATRVAYTPTPDIANSSTTTLVVDVDILADSDTGTNGGDKRTCPELPLASIKWQNWLRGGVAGSCQKLPENCGIESKKGDVAKCR